MSETNTGPTQEDVDRHVWFHTITFPNGVKSKGLKGGGEEGQRQEADAAFRYPVAGKTVLDIGAWNGYFSLEATQRGAAHVTALDFNSWVHEPLKGFDGFDLVRRYLAPNVTTIWRDVMDIRQNPIGQFEYVLFLGVLYHLRHPLYVLETLYGVTKELLVVETAIDTQETERPVMAFSPGATDGDPSNWWYPNIQCAVDMLKTVGFSRVEWEYHPTTKLRAFFYAFK